MSTYNQVQATYDNTNSTYNLIYVGAVTSTQSIGIRAKIGKPPKNIDLLARIQAQSTQTIFIKARIQQHYSQSFAAKSRIRNTYIVTLGIRSRIRKTITPTPPLSARARLSQHVIVTLGSKARIRALVTRTLGMHIDIRNIVYRSTEIRARISRQQGWPVPEINDPGYNLFQPTNLEMRANIRWPTLESTSMRILARIWWGKITTLGSKAHINTAYHLSMQARIVPRFVQSHLPATFYVQSTDKRSIRMVFYIGKGWSTIATVGMKARIAQTYRTRMTGHFLIPSRPVLSDGIMVFDFSSISGAKQTLGIRARLIR